VRGGGKGKKGLLILLCRAAQEKREEKGGEEGGSKEGRKKKRASFLSTTATRTIREGKRGKGEGRRTFRRKGGGGGGRGLDNTGNAGCSTHAANEKEKGKGENGKERGGGKIFGGMKTFLRACDPLERGGRRRGRKGK